MTKLDGPFQAFFPLKLFGKICIKQNDEKTSRRVYEIVITDFRIKIAKNVKTLDSQVKKIYQLTPY